MPIGQAPQAIAYVPDAVPDGDGTPGPAAPWPGRRGRPSEAQRAAAPRGAPTSVSLFDQGLVQVLQAAVTGLAAKTTYVLALAPGGRLRRPAVARRLHHQPRRRGYRRCGRADPSAGQHRRSRAASLSRHHHRHADGDRRGRADPDPLIGARSADGDNHPSLRAAVGDRDVSRIGALKVKHPRIEARRQTPRLHQARRFGEDRAVASSPLAGQQRRSVKPPE